MLFSPIARCFWLFLSSEEVGLTDSLPIGFLKALGLQEGRMLQPTPRISANDASQLSGVIRWRFWRFYLCRNLGDCSPRQLIKSLQLCVATMASATGVK